MDQEYVDIFFKCLLNLPFKEFFVGLFGALVGGWFTLKGAKNSHTLQVNRARFSQLETTKKSLTLIGIEISSAWDIFYKEYGRDILSEKKYEPHISVLPIGDANFTVYESLMGEIAYIDSAVAEKIVRIYSRARGL
jgi:hypothetical protein